MRNLLRDSVRGALCLGFALSLVGLAGLVRAQGEAQTFAPTTTERLALGALLERKRALDADVQAVLTDAARARGVRADRLSFDPTRGVLVLAPEPAPVATGTKP